MLARWERAESGKGDKKRASGWGGPKGVEDAARLRRSFPFGKLRVRVRMTAGGSDAA